MDFARILSHSTKKPKSILKIVISLSVVMLVLWMFMISRMETTPSPKRVAVADSSAGVSITETLLNRSAANYAAADTSGAKMPVLATSERTTAKDEKGIFQNAATTFALLVGVMGLALYFITRKKKQANTYSSKSDVADLGGHVIGQGAQLKFLEINNEVWVIGLTPGNMNLMQRVPKEFWNASNEEEPAEEDAPGDVTDSGFRDFLKPYYKNFRN